MGRNHVAVRELFEVRWHNTTVLQVNPSAIIYSGDCHNFAIGRAEIWFTAIRREQELVSRCDFNGSPFVDIEGFRLLPCERAHIATFVANHQTAFLDIHDLDSFVFTNSFHLPMEPQQLTRTIVAAVVPLSRGPI